MKKTCEQCETCLYFEDAIRRAVKEDDQKKADVMTALYESHIKHNHAAVEWRDVSWIVAESG